MKIISTVVFSTAIISAGLAPAQERGFAKGQTLPDIALINLEGEEVRFSDFLGKQVVLYGWASW